MYVVVVDTLTTVGFNGERLRKLRKRDHMSQAALGEAIEKNQQEISAYEVGEVVPETKTIIQLAQLFNVTTDYLLNLSAEPEREHESRQQPKLINDLQAAIAEHNPGKAADIFARLLKGEN